MTLLLAAKAGDLTQLRYPLIALPKLDGIRAYKRHDGLFSRNHKLIPNRHIQEWASHFLPHGVEGELVLPDVTAPHRQLAALVRAHDRKEDFLFAAFDLMDYTNEFVPYAKRLSTLDSLDIYRKWKVPHGVVHSANEAQEVFESWSDAGFEGAMLRDPGGRYLRKRCTTKSQLLLKMKFWDDEEATVTGYEEEHDKHGEPKGRLGALRGVFEDGAEFRCGSGFLEEERIELWSIRDQLQGRTFTVKFQPERVTGRQVGEVPRFPIFKGFRDDGL